MKNNIFKLIVILLLAVAALSVTLPNNNGSVLGVSVPSWFPDTDLSLGLDLQGGTQLTYVIDLSEVAPDRIDGVVSGVEEVIRRRIDGLGVSEPVIQTANVGVQKHLIVEIPGVKDLEEAKAAVGKVVELSFREEQTEPSEADLKIFAEEETIARSEAESILSQVTSESNFTELASQNLKARYSTQDSFIEIDKLDENLQTTINELSVGDISSNLVENDREYRIIKLNAKEAKEVKEVSSSHILVAYQGAERASGEVTRSKEEAKAQAESILKQLNDGADFATLAKTLSDESTENGELSAPVKQGGSYVQAFTDGALALENIGDITQEPVESSFGYHIILARDISVANIDTVQFETIAFNKPTINLNWKDTDLTGEHFDFAFAGFSEQNGEVLVNISFTEAGTELFSEITKRNINKPLAIFLDDEPIIGNTVYAPIIRNEITDGQAVISGGLNYPDAVEIAQNMNAGAIPAPISLIGQRTIGATLGETALASGMQAGLIGVLILFVYMMFYYRAAGFFADLALSIYAVVLIAIFKLWPVTLTLAGIAGIIFSIGIAVDANILIFERMKEELAKGSSQSKAVREGFDRAWTSIRDSNLSSLLICVVLFLFGSGMIRGFAITLSIGILLSMFSAITVTRTFLIAFISKSDVRNNTLVGAKNNNE